MKVTTAKPRNGLFWLLKYAILYPNKSQYLTQTYLKQKTNKKKTLKHQNQA